MVGSTGFYAVQPSSDGPAMMTRRLLPTPLVTGMGARCMDGSPGGYYVAPGIGVNKTKAVIFIEGGGECRTAAECSSWYTSHAANSTKWAPTMAVHSNEEMDSDCIANPDFCTWSKIYVPYCTGDMHSGTQTERNPELSNFFYSGHLQIAGVAADLNNELFSDAPPTHILVSGSSAGGIGALMHTDFFGEAWPAAVVKGAPRCGFFYAGVNAVDDIANGVATPVQHLGFTPQWKPWFPSACAKATASSNASMSLCTDAHFLLPHLVKPLFIRENQFDTAKLGNCGWDRANATYLAEWGGWMRSQLAEIEAMSTHASSVQHGFFSGACLQHGGNFGWETSPVIHGFHMREALSSWYFEKEKETSIPRFIYDTCSATSESHGLPCTVAIGAQICPHFGPSPGPSPGPPRPLTPECLAELAKDCAGLKGKGAPCSACIRGHAQDLKRSTCPQKFEDVDTWCNPDAALSSGGEPNGGHDVCDLSISRRMRIFGKHA